MTSTRKLRRLALGALISLALVGAACSDDDDGGVDGASAPESAEHHDEQATSSDSSSVIALYGDMRELWADHMQWTLGTVDAFFNNPDALPANLDRLLANQTDIGDAVGVYFGDEAGDALASLLTQHIEQAVPVLEAAKAGDDPALQTALDDWYANAQAIADFLSAANPDNWPPEATRPALEMHIDQTTAYAVDLLQGDYASAIEDYGHAFSHMLELGDILSSGIIAQYPDQFVS